MPGLHSVVILTCYLVAPGEEYTRKAVAFMESYARHPAGEPHDFLLVAKDGADSLVPVPLPTFDLNWHSNAGWDIGSLQRVAYDHPNYELVMWFGSHSRILADGWLAKFAAALRTPGVGAASATGSFEAGVLREAPNPHLRTSALAIRPGLLNSLNFAPTTNRAECYEFEHGDTSLYRKLKTRSLRGVVVGRDGRAYDEHQWATSRTYRSGGQVNLLIADRQTDAYLQADAKERRALAKMAGWDS